MVRIKLAILISVCVNSFLIAQSTHFSKLNQVKKEGYYKIKLSQEIIGEGTLNLKDLRLINSEEQEVPYFIKKGPRTKTDTIFKTLNILNFEKYQKGFFSKQLFSELIVENQDTLMLSALYLEINNAQVNKKIKLSGSNNNKDWYSIKDNCGYSIDAGKSNTKFLKILDFPIVNYKFIKIAMHDYSGDPIKINKVGFYEFKTQEQPKDTIVLKGFKLTNEHKDKKSVYELKLPYNFSFEYLNIHLNGTEFYNRKVNIYVSDTILNKKKELVKLKYLGGSICASGGNNSIAIKTHKSNHYIIEIINNDNQPLKISSLLGLNNPIFVVAKLNKQNYQIELGDHSLQKPNYDIVNFKNELNIASHIVDVKELKKYESTNKTESTIFPTWIIWTVIVLVFALLFTFSFKMIREMNAE